MLVLPLEIYISVVVSKRALDPKIVAAIVEVVGYQGRGGYRSEK